MPRPSLAILCLTALVGIAAVLWPLRKALSGQSSDNDHRVPHKPGRNGTVLFLTDTAHGLSNVHVATSFALLEHHPHLDVHYASFPSLEAGIARVSASAIKKNPGARPVTWHALPGPDYVTALWRHWGDPEGIVGPPGPVGVAKIVRDMGTSMAPWEAEEYWQLYRAVRDVIDEVDPAVVLVDSLFHPAMDAARNGGRTHAVISPNALTDVLAVSQPWAAMFWKFPALASGYPFPLPWRLILSNTYLQLRIIIGILTTPGISEKRAYLAERGVADPINFFELGKGSVPWLMMSFPEACIPLDHIPSYVKPCGPIVLDVAPAEQQDGELVTWLAGAPTMLVNLGSVIKYTEARALALGGALAIVLETTQAQVLWKFRKLGEYDDGFLDPLLPHIASGRLRIESWLNVDPGSLLMSGHIAVSVHHGGANCYHEAVYAGVPQVILPLWVDLYNFATTAEYLGIGIWPGRDTAPVWDSDSLADGFTQALRGDGSATLREKAQALGEIARTYGGRNTAAAEVARLATVAGQHKV